MPLPKAFGIERGWSISNNQPGGGDTTPDPFAFAPINDATLGSAYTSEAVEITGINAPAPVTVAGGLVSVNNGGFTAAPGPINNHDQVRLRRNAASEGLASVYVVVTIGGVVATWRITTADASAPAIVISNLVSPATTWSLTALATLKLGEAAAGETIEIEGAPAGFAIAGA